MILEHNHHKPNHYQKSHLYLKAKCYFHFDVHHVDIVLNIFVGILTIHKLQHVSARCLCIDFLYVSLCCETELVMTQMQLSSGGAPEAGGSSGLSVETFN